jgi:hypothetical protein
VKWSNLSSFRFVFVNQLRKFKSLSHQVDRPFASLFGSSSAIWTFLSPNITKGATSVGEGFWDTK